jgi:polysaccharide biosynthesis protein PslE
MESLYEADRPAIDVLRFVWRHKGKILITFLAGVAVTVAYLSLATRKYRSDAKLLVRIGRESISLDPTATTGQQIAMAESRESELHAVEELLSSRTTAEKIVDEFGPGIILEKKNSGRPLSDRLVWLNEYNLNPIRVYSLRDKAVKALQQNLGITAGKKSNVLSVSYKAEDPQLAHDVLTAVLTSAREEHLRVHRTSGSQAFFENQREQLRESLATQELTLRDFKDQHGLASLATQRDTQLGLIGSLQGDLLRARAEQSALQAEVDLRRKQLSGQPSLVVTEQTTGQPQTARQSLRERLYELEVREQELAARLKEDSPQLLQIRTQIAESRRIMGEEQVSLETKKGINQIHQTAELALQEREAQLVAITARSQSLESKIGGASEELKKLNAAELDLTRLEREIELARANYRKYSENLEQARIDHELDAAKISSLNLMQAPTLSQTPVSPQPLATLAMGFCLSGMASIGVALLAHRPPRRRPARPRIAPESVPRTSPPPGRPRRGETAAANPR